LNSLFSTNLDSPTDAVVVVIVAVLTFVVAALVFVVAVFVAVMPLFSCSFASLYCCWFCGAG